jgi:hypothetical protein
MLKNCFGCNVEKDTEVLEVSPFAEEDGLTGNPICPFLVLDVQGNRIPNDPDNYSEFRMTVVCFDCFHRLEPDMWISKNCWDNIHPTIPYDRLPMFVAGLYDPTLLVPLP